jgi:hypothetical protein
VTKPRFDIQSKEFMFIIMWNASSFYVIDRFPNDAKINSNYFVINLLILLKQEIFPRKRAPDQKQLVIHLDNCPVHPSQDSTDWLEENGMRCMPHPPYLLNLAFRNFYLFSTVKEKLERI